MGFPFPYLQILWIPSVSGALSETIWTVCFERLCPGLLQPPSSLCPWVFIIEALVLPGVEEVGCPLVTTWWAEALCRGRLSSSLFATPVAWSCWLWREGLAWQLSSHLILPIHTHIVHFLNGPVQWTGTCLLPVVESAQLWALGVWDLELRATWPVTHLSLSCNWCLLNRICLFFQMVLATQTPVPSRAEAFPATWGHGESVFRNGGWRCSTALREWLSGKHSSSSREGVVILVTL